MTLAEAIAAYSAGDVYRDRKNYKAAEASYRRAAQLFHSAGGSLVDRSRALHDFGYCLCKQKNYAEAGKVLNEALVIRRTLVAQLKPSLAATLHELGRCLSNQEMFDDGVKFLQEALELKRTLNNKASTALTLQVLGSCMVRKGSPDEAEGLLRESLRIYRAAFPDKKSSIAATLYWLGESLKDQHKYRDASHVYEEKLEIEKHLGPGREAFIATARKNLNLCKEKQADAAKQTSDHQQAVQNEQRELTVSVSPDSQSSQTLRRDPDDDLVGQLIGQVEQLRVEKEASGLQQRMMRDERDAATRRASKLEQEVRSLREEIASSLEEKNNEIDSLQQRVDTERQSKETLMREKERVQSELSEKDREVRHLSQQKSDLEVRLSAEASVNASLNLEVSKTDEVKPEELSRLAKCIQGSWKDVALVLAPALFTVTGEIRTIERENPCSLFVQAKTMLEIWRNEFGVNAQRRPLIKALLDLRLRVQANEVFGEEVVAKVASQQ